MSKEHGDNVIGEGRFPRSDTPANEGYSLSQFVGAPTRILDKLSETGGTGFIMQSGVFRAKVNAYTSGEFSLQRVDSNVPEHYSAHVQQEGAALARGERASMPKEASVFQYRDLVDQPRVAMNRLFAGGRTGLFSDAGSIRAKIVPFESREVVRAVLLPEITWTGTEDAVIHQLSQVRRGPRRRAPRQGQ